MAIIGSTGGAGVGGLCNFRLDSERVFGCLGIVFLDLERTDEAFSIHVAFSLFQI